MKTNIEFKELTTLSIEEDNNKKMIMEHPNCDCLFWFNKDLKTKEVKNLGILRVYEHVTDDCGTFDRKDSKIYLDTEFHISPVGVEKGMIDITEYLKENWNTSNINFFYDTYYDKDNYVVNRGSTTSTIEKWEDDFHRELEQKGVYDKLWGEKSEEKDVKGYERLDYYIDAEFIAEWVTRVVASVSNLKNVLSVETKFYSEKDLFGRDEIHNFIEIHTQRLYKNKSDLVLIIEYMKTEKGNKLYRID